MAEMDQIKSSPQNWRARGLIISVLTNKEYQKLIRGWSLTWTTELPKKILKFENFAILLTPQNQLKLSPQISSRY